MVNSVASVFFSADSIIALLKISNTIKTLVSGQISQLHPLPQARCNSTNAKKEWATPLPLSTGENTVNIST